MAEMGDGRSRDNIMNGNRMGDGRSRDNVMNGNRTGQIHQVALSTRGRSGSRFCGKGA